MKCEFGSVLDDMIRDQIVIGIFRDRTHRRLLLDAKLTLEKPLELITVEEQVDRDFTSFHEA